MNEFLIKTAQLLTSLSILVILHELGHFIPAKLFGTKVEKFYLFFNPWFSLFKVKKGETEYGVGWLPLGGYVKIAGMIDESMDKEQMKQPPQPWEFRAKPAWQRLIIMLGGVTVNLILGIIIYSMTLFVYGEQTLPNESLKDGVWVTDSLALNMGFKSGDKIISINNQPINYFEEIMPAMLYAKTVVVERQGRKETIAVPNNFIAQLIDSKIKTPLFAPRMPVIVADVPDTSAAKEAGLKKLDIITAVDGNVVFFDSFKETLSKMKGDTVALTVKREEGDATLVTRVSEDGKLGVVVTAVSGYSELSKLGFYKFKEVELGFFESIPAGFNKAIDKLGFYIKQFKLIFSPETGAYKSLGGFGSIGGLFPPEWDWRIFWELTAFLSLMLAFMNILPIPALDGGHVMFLLYEVVTGRKPGEKFMEYAQYAGMILLLMLLVYANANDVVRLFNK